MMGQNLCIFLLYFLANLESGHLFGWSQDFGTHTTITTNGIDQAIQRYFKDDPSLITCAKKSQSYQDAVRELIDGNNIPDSDPIMYWIASYHFDAEMFSEGFENLVQRRKNAKEALRLNNVSLARQEIGIALHGVQDFYAHTNWVELGNKFPSPGTTGRLKVFGVVLADAGTVACKPCDDAHGCDGNVVTEKLTSGYFKDETDKNGRTIMRPSWKCHHGGDLDGGSIDAPMGGINKDNLVSPHARVHQEAARIAEMATTSFLNDFHREVGNHDFELLLGLDQDQFSKECKSTFQTTTETTMDPPPMLYITPPQSRARRSHFGKWGQFKKPDHSK